LLWANHAEVGPTSNSWALPFRSSFGILLSVNSSLRSQIVAVFTAALVGCVGDVAHENPLDPESPSYSPATSLDGRLTVRDHPDIPVAGALVSDSSGSYACLSTSDGSFGFPSLPVSVSRLFVLKEGFEPETVSVSLAVGEHRTLPVALNALPSIESASVAVSRIAVWFPSTTYLAKFAAVAADLNGVTDIDSVWLLVDSLRFSMTYSITSKNFELTLRDETFPGNSIQYLVGKPLFTIARDASSSTGTSEPFYVSRIIEEEPRPSYPVSVPVQDTVTFAQTGLTFRWNEPIAGFPFSFIIVLARVDNPGVKTVIWTSANIPFYETSADYNGAALSPSSYSWTLTMIDEFGNSSISKEYEFVVR